MLGYILRRLIYMIPTLFGITLLTFLLFNVAGGDPAAQLAGLHATPQQIEDIRVELGLNQPLYKQYFDYVGQIVRFDFGRSWATKQTIGQMILGRSLEDSPILASLSLTIPVFVLNILLSIIIALVLTQVRGSFLDQSTMVSCLAAMSISSLAYILFLQYYLGYKLALFPISGWDPSFFGRWEYLILPILIFVILSLGGKILFYRTIFLDEIYQDYVRTARSKGLGTKSVLFKHILRNALIPIITLEVLSMPFLILGSILVESFFAVPGLGGLLVLAINNADFPVIKAMTFIGAVLYMIFQLISDLLYVVVDPKVRLY